MEKQVEVPLRELDVQEIKTDIPTELVNLRKEVLELRKELRNANMEMMRALNGKDEIVREMHAYIRDAERYRAVIHLFKSIEGFDGGDKT